MFRPDRRRLVLTEAGTAVVAAARRALDAVDDVQRTARELALGSELVLVSTPTNSTLLGAIVAAFIRSRPSVALRFAEPADMQDVVRDGQRTGRPISVSATSAIAARPGSDPLRAAVVGGRGRRSPVGSDLPAVVPVARLGELQLVLPPDGSERRTMINDLVI